MLLTLLGAAGEKAGIDKCLTGNTSKSFRLFWPPRDRGLPSSVRPWMRLRGNNMQPQRSPAV